MKRLSKLIALLMLCALMVGAAAPAFAAEEPRLLTETLWAGCDMTAIVCIENLPENAEIVKVKSSKPAVIKVTKETYEGANYFFLWPQKVGKSKVTVKYKVGKTTKTLKGTYVVKDYPAPLKKLVVNGKKVNLKDNLASYDVNPYKKASATVKATPADGWLIANMFYYVNYGQAKSASNGKAFKFTKGSDTYLDIMLMNAKGECFEYYVGFNH